MPEPMPTSWLSPVKPQPPSALMRQLGSGLLGLTLGLALTVPAVLWHKGRIDPLIVLGWTAADLGLAIAAPASTASAKAREASTGVPGTLLADTPRAASITVDIARSPIPAEPAAPSASVTAVAAVTDSAPRDNPSAGTMVVLQPPPVYVAPPTPEPPRSEVLLEEARRLIGEGDFSAARRTLEDRELAGIAEAHFLLAETFDPNFLAARGIRSVRAEVPRAIALYRQALDGGIDAARQRLTALRP